MRPGKTFNLSKTSKGFMATLLPPQSHAYKRAMIQAEIAASIQPPRRERNARGNHANHNDSQS